MDKITYSLILAAAPLFAQSSFHYACGLSSATNTLTDNNGMVWQSDTSILNSGTSLPWSVQFTNPPNSTQSLVYNSLRFGSTISYTIPTGPGVFNIILHLMEPNQTTVGARQFMILVNGIPLFLNLDLVQVVGSQVPFDSYFVVNNSAPNLNIELVAGIRTAVISGFEVISAIGNLPLTYDSLPDVIKTYTALTSPTIAVLGTVTNLHLYKNGLFQVPNSDYTLTGNTITLNVTPVATDNFVVSTRPF
jgi:Malectin domain